jgi:predicted GNAT superfamily acetyltransferase
MIRIRQLFELEDLRTAVQLQKDIWGFSDIELLPLRLFVVANKVGGHSFGAFDGERMVGFLIAIPGIKPGGKGFLHSHMMGVVAEYRDMGIGRRLKLAQAEEALSRGLDLIEWTFDPLEIKNAFFNMERLGAIVRRYVENQYGTTSSPLHGGLPTDRCVAEWWLGRERRQAEIVARVAVPADVECLRQTEPRRAREIQKRLGEELQDCFRRDLAVVGFECTATEGIYLLGPWQ